MVGMTRAHMTDPHIVRKIIEGREDRHPSLRRRELLPGPDLPGRRRLLYSQRRHGARIRSCRTRFARAAIKRKVVVVGAGPAGLEAARVAAERGHAVVVFEAAQQPGGQVRLTARSPRRREMLGIIDWRMRECAALGVEFRFDSSGRGAGRVASRATRTSSSIATGGLPHTDVLRIRQRARRLDLGRDRRRRQAGRPTCCSSTMPAITPRCRPPSSSRRAGAKLEIMTPDRSFAPEVMAMNLVPYMRACRSWT